MTRDRERLDDSYFVEAGELVVSALRGVERRRRLLFGDLVDAPWSIETRIKSQQSIAAKLARKASTYTLDDMTDLVGVRAVVESQSCASHLARIVRQRFAVQEAEDFSETPRGDGYRGIHLILGVHTATSRTVAVELQIRTILQHQWSGLSHSEFYKQVSEIPPSMLIRMRSLSETLNSAEVESEQLRRGRILDECAGKVRDLLVKTVDRLYGSPPGSQAIGATALHLLEFDKKLRRTLIEHGDVQKRAFEALAALSRDGSASEDAALAGALAEIVRRVRIAVEPCAG